MPLIVKSADGLRMPDHYAEQVQLADFFPLALELAGIQEAHETSILDRMTAGSPIGTMTFAQVRHTPSAGVLESSQWESEPLRFMRTDTPRAMRDAAGHLTLTTIDGCDHAMDPASMPWLFLRS